MRAAILLWLALALLPGAASGALRVEFLRAEAGEHGASGGHVALRIGERAYHYQRDGEGALVLVRDSWRDFDFRYRALENRALEAWPLALPDESATALRAHLDARFLTGLLERERIDALREDVALLEALDDPAGGSGFAMRGAGFFARGRAPQGPVERAARDRLVALRERIARARGADFLAARRREVADALRDLPLPDDAGTTPDLAAHPFARRYADAWAAALALDVLEEAPVLRRDALRALPEATLADAERRALAAGEEALAASLAELVASPRPDWGFAFVLGAARLAALGESLGAGRLVVLDALPEEAARVPLPGSPADADAQLAWRRARLDAARAGLAARPADDRARASLERAATLHGELASALREDAFPVWEGEAMLPHGRATVGALPGPAFAERSLGPELARARARLEAAQHLRAERDAYDLVTRNCVTELLASIEAGLAGTATPLAPPGSPLVFIPFSAARGVGAHWASAPPRRLASLRSVAVRSARREGWLAALREASPLTSSVYTPHTRDSIFVFFTDDTLLARPLLGAANLAAGVAGAAAGILWLPADGGVTLARGLQGAAASLPELVFGNVRKGTFPLARPVE